MDSAIGKPPVPGPRVRKNDVAKRASGRSCRAPSVLRAVRSPLKDDVDGHTPRHLHYSRVIDASMAIERAHVQTNFLEAVLK